MSAVNPLNSFKTVRINLIQTRLTTLKSSSVYHVGFSIKGKDEVDGEVDCEVDGEVDLKLLEGF